MKITKNTVVSVTYDLEVSDAENSKSFVERADETHPLVFLFGSGNLIPAFEDHLNGLSVGDTFEFEIEAAKGYGLKDESAVATLPKSIFVVDGKLDDEVIKVGNMVPMSDQDGNKMDGKILEVKENEVIMDFNHPLAGKNLHFKGTVTEVREAVAEEISHGHVHQHGDHHHH
jgi:FKBP-type peptidyl-prolyl cis-trans isomerase SlyD